MKPEFIANIDEANAEVVRLSTELQQMTALRDTAAAKIIEHEASLTSLNLRLTEHQSTITARDATIAEQGTRLSNATVEITALKGEATRLIAAAGVKTPVVDPKKADDPAAKTDNSGLSGLQRAIAGRQAELAAK